MSFSFPLFPAIGVAKKGRIQYCSVGLVCLSFITDISQGLEAEEKGNQGDTGGIGQAVDHQADVSVFARGRRGLTS